PAAQVANLCYAPPLFLRQPPRDEFLQPGNLADSERLRRPHGIGGDGGCGTDLQSVRRAAVSDARLGRSQNQASGTVARRTGCKPVLRPSAISPPAAAR